MNSDCGMFGDVILIFHDTEILIFVKKESSGRNRFICNGEYWTTAAFTVVSWFYVKPCSLTAVISN